MNQDKNTTEYLESLGKLKLSESSRARMEGELLEYARFHPVRVGQVSRSSKVPLGTALFGNKFTIMPIALLLAVFVGVGTTFAAQGSVPGDVLYPVKTNVNENVGSALAVGADAQARFEAKLLEERIEEAEELEAEGRLNGDLAVSVSDQIALQADAAASASANSDAEIKSDIESRTKVALQKFISLVGAESSVAAKVSAKLHAISLSEGEMDLQMLKSDVTARITGLKNVVANAAADLQADVETRVNAKLDAAVDLTIEASNQTEVEVREALNEAATLIGEVEAELSTLGQVEVNGNGMITDIDFSVDPMILLNGDDDSTSTDDGDDSTGSDAGADVDAGINVDVDANTDLIDVNGAAGAAAEGHTGLGI